MTLQQFRDDTAHMPGETELLIVDSGGWLCPGAFFVRDDLDEHDELRDQLDDDSIVLSEAAE